MKTLNISATKTFLKLIEGLSEPGEGRKIDNSNGTYMAVSVDFLTRVKVVGGFIEHYAVAHRYEQNGDLVPDPDVEFYVNRCTMPNQNPVCVCPFAIEHVGRYSQYARFEDGTGFPTHVNVRGQADLASFCGTWLRNIKTQQGLK